MARVLLLVTVLSLQARMAWAGDFYVITRTFSTQEPAQEAAALQGGWVLDTDWYPKLTPNLYAVVRGPFRLRKDAEAELAFLKGRKAYAGAYVRDAGPLVLPPSVSARGIPGALLVALLGELGAAVQEMPGGENPCEPQEPYLDVTISFAGIERRVPPEPDRAERQAVDLGGLWIIKRTGEIVRMRVCEE